jgi:multidrug resistance efflux pump
MPRAGRAILVQVVVWVVLLGAAAIAGTYWYQGQNYVITNDAQVTVPMAAVGAPAAGTLTSWSVKEGDAVTAGQVLGVVRPGPAAGASAAPSLDVVAPMAGTVLEQSAVAGETVVPGETLAYVGDLSSPSITAYVKETDIRNVAAGQRVDATVDAFPGTTFAGKVQRIGLATAGTFSLLPAAPQGGEFTKVTQRIPVVIALQGPSGQLLPGESATVKIHIR